MKHIKSKETRNQAYIYSDALANLCTYFVHKLSSRYNLLTLRALLALHPRARRLRGKQKPRRNAFFTAHAASLRLVWLRWSVLIPTRGRSRLLWVGSCISRCTARLGWTTFRNSVRSSILCKTPTILCLHKHWQGRCAALQAVFKSSTARVVTTLIPVPSVHPARMKALAY